MWQRRGKGRLQLCWADMAVVDALVVIHSQLAFFKNLPKVVFMACVASVVYLKFSQYGREGEGAKTSDVLG